MGTPYSVGRSVESSFVAVSLVDAVAMMLPCKSWSCRTGAVVSVSIAASPLMPDTFLFQWPETGSIAQEGELLEPA